jgi:hypothetical protein
VYIACIATKENDSFKTIDSRKTKQKKTIQKKLLFNYIYYKLHTMCYKSSRTLRRSHIGALIVPVVLVLATFVFVLVTLCLHLCSYRCSSCLYTLPYSSCSFSRSRLSPCPSCRHDTCCARRGRVRACSFIFTILVKSSSAYRIVLATSS